MGDDVNRSFESKDGFAVTDDDGVLLFWVSSGNVDPQAAGLEAPKGSVYYQRNVSPVKPWFKQSDGDDFDWTEGNFAGATEAEGDFDDDEETTTSNGWVTTGLNFTSEVKSGGKYYVGWSTEVGQSDKQKTVGMRVQFRDPSGSGTWQTLTDTRNGVSFDDVFALRSGFKILENLTAGNTYQIRIQFGQTDDGGTGKIQNKEIFLYRIGD